MHIFAGSIKSFAIKGMSALFLNDLVYAMLTQINSTTNITYMLIKKNLICHYL